LIASNAFLRVAYSVGPVVPADALTAIGITGAAGARRALRLAKILVKLAGQPKFDPAARPRTATTEAAIAPTIKTAPMRETALLRERIFFEDEGRIEVKGDSLLLLDY
jgi:hypothetical protein